MLSRRALLPLAPALPIACRLAATIAAIAACAGAIAGCGPSAEEKDRAAVASAIDRLRATSPDDYEGRMALVRELRGLDVHDKDAIAARDACARAYELLTEILHDTDRATIGLDPASSADPRGTVGALKRADRLGQESAGAVDACTNASAAIRVKK
jgi:hypothetical protein